MTSSNHREAFVWIWLPGETEPVVAGRLATHKSQVRFHYGKSYLARAESQPTAMPIYEPELPLRAGAIAPLGELHLASCIRDASPDAWGRRVIDNKILGSGRTAETAELNELTYLLESGSDRTGALDFQKSPTEYVPRDAGLVSMEDLMRSAERVEKGQILTPGLDQALFHGSSIGGARPKALIQDQGCKYVAKFSSSSDLYSVVKAEFIAMRLAQLAGLKVARVKLMRVAGKDLLLVERFDRETDKQGWSRKAMVSALTLLGLDEMQARYASYEQLAEIIRHRFSSPKATLKELFSRLVFNVLCGNTDDHARNHAAFWNGRELTLTPAYDICPQGRTGNEASQAMRISGDRNLSQVSLCLEAASTFLLAEDEAMDITRGMITSIEEHWDSVCNEAGLSAAERVRFWKRQFLNPFSVGDLGGS